MLQLLYSMHGAASGTCRIRRGQAATCKLPEYILTWCCCDGGAPAARSLVTLFLGPPPQRRHHAGLAAECVPQPALHVGPGAAAAALSLPHIPQSAASSQ